MNQIINIEKALDSNSKFIDVRTAKEFIEGTIPGSVNFPILTEEEREIVSKTYFQDKTQGLSLGLNYASNKLNDYFDFLTKHHNQHAPVVFFCWRGGMRSKGITEVMNLMKLDCHQLIGGYRGYRKHIVSKTPELLNNKQGIVIHGLTGSGKTEIINILDSKYKSSILDLEKMANNKGSIFGDINMGNPNSQKTFDSLLFNQLTKHQRSPYLIMESESARIGNIYLPNFLIDLMNKSLHILVKTSLEARVNRLFNEYETGYHQNPEIIDKRIETLQKKLGKHKVDNLKFLLKRGEIKPFIELILNNYYDPLYSYSLEKHPKFELIVDGDDPELSADYINSFLESYNFRGDGW